MSHKGVKYHRIVCNDDPYPKVLWRITVTKERNFYVLWLEKGSDFTTPASIVEHFPYREDALEAAVALYNKKRKHPNK